MRDKNPENPARIHFAPGTHGSVASAPSPGSRSSPPPSRLRFGATAASRRSLRRLSSCRRDQPVRSSSLHVPMATSLRDRRRGQRRADDHRRILPLRAASNAIAVTGISVIELVLIASSMHIAFVATPGRLFSLSSSLIARSPSGVAALFRPEDIRRHVQHDRAHRRMVRRHLGKKPAQDRPQRQPEPVDQPRLLRQPHQAEPQRHHRRATSSRADRPRRSPGRSPPGPPRRCCLRTRPSAPRARSARARYNSAWPAQALSYQRARHRTSLASFAPKRKVAVALPATATFGASW